MSLWNPTWLLLGPLLLMMRYNREQKIKSVTIKLFHLTPFMAMMFMFMLTSYHNSFGNNLSEYFYSVYQKMFVLVPISLFAYGIATSFPLRKKIADLAHLDDLQLGISGFYVLIASVSLTMHLCWAVLKVDMVVDYRIIIYALVLVMVTLIFYALSILSKIEQPQETQIGQDEHTLILNLNQVREYEHKLQSFLIGEQTFLNPNLSLATLSKELKIPKHHLTVLFNQHLGKSFYSYLATLRIDYAIVELQKTGNNFTIESLAYQSGFNSKTSFHKYFREYTGLTPIAFIQQKSKSA
ncbi:helix-turn-helix domain-containing protein [Pedobacter namyangjuensis]|uniref:helix-turn-helix domain-containing protein n=1 Tax=Pedobacter namyangjuensis TaxID=600626 RepID=UPI0013B44E08|nr:helix-turn-helix domain-containing protein [Pedobacter namyangjuensis]